MIEPRVVYLALPSAVALALLVVHSVRALPRRRAVAFWVAVLGYGLARGLGVAFITRAIGAKFPYELHHPLLRILGVSVQEIAGWAVVGYLAWWIGSRFTDRVFAQAAIGALFLGCVSWAVEAAAIAAGWWHWTVPTASRFFLNVPPIGIVDWFFVATDFLLPFVAITALRTPWRFATLLLFPLHFGAHALPAVALDAAHWSLLALLIALALRSNATDVPFAENARALPFVAAGIILADIAFVLVFVVREPRLLLAVAPLALLVAGGWRSRRVPASPPAQVRRSTVGVMVGAILAIGVAMHVYDDARDEELQRRLDGAIRARDQGQLAFAAVELEALAHDFPATHVPLALLGEIYYRTNRPSEAAPLFERAYAIKQDYLDGYRYAAVIALQNGDRERAVRIANRGLDVAPRDAQLRYLAGERVEPSSADEAMTLAGLAFEAGDRASTIEILDRAIARWPAAQRLRGLRAHLK